MNVCEENLAFGEQIAFIDSHASQLMTILRSISYDGRIDLCGTTFLWSANISTQPPAMELQLKTLKLAHSGIRRKFLWDKYGSRNLVSS
jgi:hypothetical protein